MNRTRFIFSRFSSQVWEIHEQTITNKQFAGHDVKTFPKVNEESLTIQQGCAMVPSVRWLRLQRWLGSGGRRCLTLAAHKLFGFWNHLAKNEWGPDQGCDKEERKNRNGCWLISDMGWLMDDWMWVLKKRQELRWSMGLSLKIVWENGEAIGEKGNPETTDSGERGWVQFWVGWIWRTCVIFWWRQWFKRLRGLEFQS